VFTSERWSENVRLVGPSNAVRVRLPWLPILPRSAAARTVRRLPAETPVILVAGAPCARLRCRAFAAWNRIELEHEYLAFPSVRTPAYLVQAEPASVRLFASSILAVPPGSAFRLPFQLAIRVLRSVSSVHLVRALAPGRVAVGRRT
jgi:hypothetical protein